MDDAVIKPIRAMVKEEVKVLHGEVAKIKRDISDLKSNYFLYRVALEKLDRDIARIDSTLENHTEKLDIIDKQVGENMVELTEHSMILDQHTNKLDALQSDMVQVQQTGKATYELMQMVAEKLGIEVHQQNK